MFTEKVLSMQPKLERSFIIPTWLKRNCSCLAVGIHTRFLPYAAASGVFLDVVLVRWLSSAPLEGILCVCGVEDSRLEPPPLKSMCSPSLNTGCREAQGVPHPPPPPPPIRSQEAESDFFGLLKAKVGGAEGSPPGVLRRVAEGLI